MNLIWRDLSVAVAMPCFVRGGAPSRSSRGELHPGPPRTFRGGLFRSVTRARARSGGLSSHRRSGGVFDNQASVGAVAGRADAARSRRVIVIRLRGCVAQLGERLHVSRRRGFESHRVHHSTGVLGGNPQGAAEAQWRRQATRSRSSDRRVAHEPDQLPTPACSSAWKSARFGSERPGVQIPLRRPSPEVIHTDFSRPFVRLQTADPYLTNPNPHPSTAMARLLCEVAQVRKQPCVHLYWTKATNHTASSAGRRPSPCSSGARSRSSRSTTRRSAR